MATHFLFRSGLTGRPKIYSHGRGNFLGFFSEPSSKRTGKAAVSLGGNFFRAEEDDDAAIRFGILK